MLLDEPGNNLALAVFHVRRLQNLAGPAPAETLDAVMRAQLPDTFQSRYQEMAANYPRAWYGGNNHRKVIYIDGVRTANQASLLWSGYNNGTGPLAINGYNPYLRDASLYFRSFMFTGHSQVPEYLDIVGYSGGGAIAVRMKDDLLAQGSTIKSRVITFGSPRTGNSDMITRLGRSPITRWMTTNDPVPLLPPTALEVPALFMSVSGQTNFRYQSFRHTSGGVEVYPDGVLKDSVVPETASINATFGIASWLLGVENDAGSGHALQTYASSLQRALESHATPSEQNADESPTEDRETLSRREMTQGERNTLALIANASSEQNAVPLVIPPQVLFKAAKVGRVWSVLFGGELIAVAGREDRARSIARSGNDFLRKLPRQALVDIETLAGQMVAFLNVASDPTGGFTPPINIGL